MIKKHCFEEDWIGQFKNQREHGRIDNIMLEKMIYALHLLERLKDNGLEFVFKGGTSLILLLDEGNRFSIDIDIISKTTQEDMEKILDMVIETSNFTQWELDRHRSYKEGVPKAHYKLFFKTGRNGSGKILLDVLIEDSLYPHLIELPVAAKWIETDGETMIKVPSIDSITGDKLTAFAPETIGIPYFKGKDKQPFSMEICKQLFDLSRLFERIENIELVAVAFNAFAEKEIMYRKNSNSDVTLTRNQVLEDTIKYMPHHS